MTCPKCGKEINKDAKFCNGCGTPIAEAANTNQPAQPVQQAKQPKSGKNIFVESLMYIISSLLKPAKTLKEKGKEFDNPKNGLILAGIVSAATMLIRVIVSFLMALIDRPCIKSWDGKKTCVTIDESLKNIQWLDITLKHLFIVFIVILAIAGLFYLGSLVAKKNTKYMRLVNIATIAFVPALLALFLLTPIFSWLFNLMKIGEFTLFISSAGIIYALAVFYTLMKEEIAFDSKDVTIYFFSILTLIIIIILYFIVKNIILNSLGDMVGNGLSGSLLK